MHTTTIGRPISSTPVGAYPETKRNITFFGLTLKSIVVHTVTYFIVRHHARLRGSLAVHQNVHQPTNLRLVGSYHPDAAAFCHCVLLVNQSENKLLAWVPGLINILAIICCILEVVLA
jgi:hypothetical protein